MTAAGASRSSLNHATAGPTIFSSLDAPAPPEASLETGTHHGLGVAHRSLLSAHDVTVAFGGIRAVDNVSISFASSGCVALIGPNGAGKTTLLDALGGLRRPSKGRILYDGVDVTRSTPIWRARHGMRRTFQRHQAFGRLTVAENVLVALEWRERNRNLMREVFRLPGTSRSRREHLDRVDEVLERCALHDVRDQPAAALPIGQVRLLEFARAIVDRPRLLLLDEPTSGLGAVETELLGSIISELTRAGCAAVLVEHDLDFVMGLCDRVVVLDQGSILADGSPAEVRNDPAVIHAYIGDHGAEPAADGRPNTDGSSAWTDS